MNKTPNFALNQWESTDRILMADFNADNAKIDAALAAQAAAVAKCGNCRLESYSYTGTETTPSKPTVFRFSKPPLLFFVWGGASLLVGSSLSNEGVVIATDGGAGIATAKLTWSGSQASLTMGNVHYQLNYSGKTYYVFALLVEDE